MVIIYRYSDSPDLKPKALTKLQCLENFQKSFLVDWRKEGKDNYRKVIFVVDHNLDTKELEQFVYTTPFVSVEIHRADCSSASSSQLAALDLVMTLKPYETVYLLEDDFYHDTLPKEFLEEGLGIFDYVTLYDHPDKYLVNGPNARVTGSRNGYGSENTQVFLTKSTHWKITDSTVMTFAAKAGTLQADMDIIRNSVGQKFPDSYNMFESLRKQRGRIVGSCLPGRSTHAETAWLTPFLDTDI